MAIQSGRETVWFPPCVCELGNLLAQPSDHLKVATDCRTDIEWALRQISRRVLEDVWISGRVRAFTLGAIATLGGGVLWGWLSSRPHTAAQTQTAWVSQLTLGAFTLAAVLSSAAIGLRRFRWCCAAAYVTGIATVLGLGTVWWHQTAPLGRSAGPAAWMFVGVLSCATLTAVWLIVIVTPLERSQPDLRSAIADR